MPRKVLIVDDEPNIVISLQFLMKKAGFDTAVARDGDEALTEVEQFRPDLVLLDVMMPRRDGYEVCQQLRGSGWTDLKIVMLTAKGREAEMTKGLALGADAYVTKPFSTSELVDTVTPTADRRWLRCAPDGRKVAGCSRRRSRPTCRGGCRDLAAAVERHAP